MVGSRTTFKNTLSLGGIFASYFTTVWHQNVQVENLDAADCCQFRRDELSIRPKTRLNFTPTAGNPVPVL